MAYFKRAEFWHRTGFYLTFVGKLLHQLNLTDEDQTILRLLTLARVPIDRTVALSTEVFPAAPVLRKLIALGTVNITNEGRIEVAGVLREYFDPKELAPEVLALFTVGDVYASLCKKGALRFI